MARGKASLKSAAFHRWGWVTCPALLSGACGVTPFRLVISGFASRYGLCLSLLRACEFASGGLNRELGMLGFVDVGDFDRGCSNVLKCLCSQD